MFSVEVVPIVHVVEESKLSFDLKKVSQVYADYTTNYHAGLTLVMGHPFQDPQFRKRIKEEQAAIKGVFTTYGLEESLILYDVETQVHATLVELASQHDKTRTDQQLLNDSELFVSSKTQNPMNINFAVRWIKKTSPFEIELGPYVLSEEHRDQTLRITDAGQIVIKGRAKDRKLLAEIRAEFEDQAGVVHKYGKDDDEFFVVIGFLKPGPQLNDPAFRLELERCIEARRPNLQVALKVDSVKAIMYNSYSLASPSCLWESRELKLLHDPEIPCDNLLDRILDVVKEKMAVTESQELKAI